MNKNYFWLGMAAGAVIGAAASLLHSETRDQQVRQLKGIKSKLKSSNTSTEAHAVGLQASSKGNLKDRVMEWKSLYEENQDTIQNLVEDVKDLVDALQEARHKNQI
ncbi:MULTISPECIES: hypothetical protein [Exiguobacterium]|jgi:gas vesicle protein|uniref:Uncharacterized protein n=2 Tax=Exiguobacterium TaxID=33986 RepID=C4L123_EXISA|nr:MULTISPECIES: hypothetical protein [Exiguobacterium]MCC9625110.1 hypothetical protein [Thalassospira sp. MA62]QLQ22885.1 MAG: hypothetical protein HZT42_12295 [Paracoccaceae bacterium]QPI67427.1 hypothetical protein IR194_13510 [Exiguobacterium sp. PBE]ACQ70986.1 hypothetical protein EAT1b_2063 [Exiguobacterium sp. AT1b]MBG0916264.1 hypothetical protein [Exiguobacterium sp. SRB7LM]